VPADVAWQVMADKDKQTITLENFATTPVLLQSVNRQASIAINDDLA
jgi:hypothetical protein